MTQKRSYNIPLRSSFRNTERYNKTKRATRTVRAFLEKHMKADTVKLGGSLNLKLWEHGGRNPPHHIAVVCEKDDEGVVYAELEGEQLPSEIAAEQEASEKKDKKEEKKPAKKDAAKDTPKPEKKEAKPAKNKPAPKQDEKKNN